MHFCLTQHPLNEMHLLDPLCLCSYNYNCMGFLLFNYDVVSNHWYSSNIPEGELSCGLVLNVF